MLPRSYLKLESWHVLKRVDEIGWHTYCGRTIVGEKARGDDALPLGEKSCESCARLVLVAEDRAAAAIAAERDPEPGA